MGRQMESGVILTPLVGRRANLDSVRMEERRPRSEEAGTQESSAETSLAEVGNFLVRRVVI